MMRALFMYVLILSAICKIKARKVEKLHPYGEEHKDDFLIFYKHVVSKGDFLGDKVTFRFPESGALHKFKITRMAVKDYNPHVADVELLTGGANEEYAEFEANSPWSRQLDIEFFIYGVYEGPCYRINKFDNYTLSLNRKGHMYNKPLIIPIH